MRASWDPRCHCLESATLLGPLTILITMGSSPALLTRCRTRSSTYRRGNRQRYSARTPRALWEVKSIGMKWSQNARELFRNMMEKGPPSELREAATRGVKRETERIAKARNAIQVEDLDVAKGCLGVVPAIFRASVLAGLAKRGFDADELTRTVLQPTMLPDTIAPQRRDGR